MMSSMLALPLNVHRLKRSVFTFFFFLDNAHWRVHFSLKWVQRRNDRKHIDLCVWEPWNKYSMAHKELANKHGMHRMLLEDGSLQRRIKNMQGNDLDTPTFFLCMSYMNAAPVTHCIKVRSTSSRLPWLIPFGS